MASAREIQYEGHHLHSFHNFKTAHGKRYQSSDEERRRQRIFDENVRFIVLHNESHRKGRKSYHVGVNQFADWTWSLEGQNKKATGKLVSLSEQQLVDCCPHAPDGGGNINTAFNYIKTCGGIEPEELYPYEGKQDRCRFERAKSVVKVKDFNDIESGSERQLQEAVATIGPISVAIDASPRAFMHYSGGVYDEPSASSVDLNHAVLCVGYGEESRKEYWIVKNSWGGRWGEDGYIRMARNKGNQSGIATMASYPLV